MEVKTGPGPYVVAISGHPGLLVGRTSFNMPLDSVTTPSRMGMKLNGYSRLMQRRYNINHIPDVETSD